MSYVYIKSKGHNLYTVGFYHHDGTWEPETDWSNSDDAARRVRYLNGGGMQDFSNAAKQEQRRVQDIGRSGPCMHEID